MKLRDCQLSLPTARGSFHVGPARSPSQYTDQLTAWPNWQDVQYADIEFSSVCLMRSP